MQRRSECRPLWRSGRRVFERKRVIWEMKRKRKDELEERVCERERRSVVELVGSRENEKERKKRTRTKTKKERSAVYFYR